MSMSLREELAVLERDNVRLRATLARRPTRLSRWAKAAMWGLAFGTLLATALAVTVGTWLGDGLNGIAHVPWGGTPDGPAPPDWRPPCRPAH
jgi:hypothetical protein